MLQYARRYRKMPKDDRSLWPIPAFLLIGVGIGLLTGQIAAFVIIGLGTGLFVSYLGSRK